jgi:hypothetical protein
LLDTDTSIEIMRGRNGPVLERLAATTRTDVALSIVTVAELLLERGAARTPREIWICPGNFTDLLRYCRSRPRPPNYRPSAVRFSKRAASASAHTTF